MTYVPAVPSNQFTLCISLSGVFEWSVLEYCIEVIMACGKCLPKSAQVWKNKKNAFAKYKTCGSVWSIWSTGFKFTTTKHFKIKIFTFFSIEAWVAHLRMTVYKGIGKHCSPQSPAMNFDRSAVSLRCYREKFPLIMLIKLTGCKTSTILYMSLSTTYDLRGGVTFGPQGHNSNKLGRGSLDDATYIISWLYGKKIFHLFAI